MHRCGWGLWGALHSTGALTFQRYRLKACALAEGWLKDQYQKASDGLASLEEIRDKKGPMILTYRMGGFLKWGYPQIIDAFSLVNH